jgi:ParB family transcriptional regulator, chromosome partitioning protein
MAEITEVGEQLIKTEWLDAGLRTIPLTDIVDNPENPRAKGGDIKSLAASIGQIGLIEPIVVRELTEGLFMVVSGHRRFAALKLLGRYETQALVRDFDATSELTSAIAENSVRQDLTPLELGESMARLSGLGVSDEEITAALGVKAEQVEHARTISKAKKANKTAIEKYGVEDPLTLEEAAAVARFLGDKEYGRDIDRAIKYNRKSLPHVVAQIDADIAFKAKFAELETLFKGVPKLAKYDNWYGPDLSMEPVANLTTAEGKTISSKEHQTCPGNAVEFITDKATPRALIWCTDWAKHGHKKAAKAKVKVRREKRYTGSSGKTGKPPTEAEKAKASAERRQVILNNKLWAPATTVRKDWIAEFCARKSLTAEAKAWVMAEVVTQPNLLPSYNEAYLGADKVIKEPLDRLFVELFHLIAKNREALLKIGTWRPGQEPAALKRYILFLESQGYPVSEVEGILVGRKAPVPEVKAVSKAPLKKAAPAKKAAKKPAKRVAKKRAAAVKKLVDRAVDGGDPITVEDLERVEEEVSDYGIATEADDRCPHNEFLNGECLGCGQTHAEIDALAGERMEA